MSIFFLKPFNDFLFPTEPISKSLWDGSIISSSADVTAFSFWDGGWWCGVCRLPAIVLPFSYILWFWPECLFPWGCWLWAFFFFFFYCVHWVWGPAHGDNFMFASAWGLRISVLRDTELGFLPQEAKNFHIWPLSFILNWWTNILISV